MKIIEKDILTIEHGYICHQTNCLGVMGRGIAAQVREKHAHVFKAYEKLCKDKLNQGAETSLLGTIQIVPINETPPVRIINCFSQLKFGGDVCHTDYNAIKSCFSKIKMMNIKKMPVYIPFKYGSDLGGGLWSTVRQTIEEVYPDVIICILPSIAETMRAEGKKIH
jgi:O-acetyl-ADP-ribose deacetylase (regulator of RNase III)